MQHSFEEYKQIASLLGDKGYLLLLERIRAAIDDTANDVEAAEPAKETQLVAKWRAMRQIYALLASTPQYYAEQLQEMKEQDFKEKGPQLPGRFIPQKIGPSNEELLALKEQYERLTGEKVPVIL